jgi:paraquat-inducible protein A
MMIACQTCGLLQRVETVLLGSVAECPRCRSIVTRPKSNGLARTAAFSLAALIFYVPANIYPILSMDFYGAYSESTVWDGCVQLFQSGQWPIAAVVFFASILAPLLKLLGLFTLVTTVKYKVARWRQERMWIYKIIGVIGPWAMLDVFLVAILIALVKLGRLATVLPGTGLLAFTAVVVFTTLASISFDSRLIWEDKEKSR